MCQFPVFETLAIMDGKINHLDYHQQRLSLTMDRLFHAKHHIMLNEVINIPKEYQQGLVRCRIDYNADHFMMTFSPYKKRKINHYQCIYLDKIDYAFKYTDRAIFDKVNLIRDEAIFIHRGYVSDCRIGNLLFLRENHWYSPSHYLLKGTQLHYLLDTHQVSLTEIKAEDIHQYEKIMMINALNPFDEKNAISTQFVHL